jgi:hypothetical protein
VPVGSVTSTTVPAHTDGCAADADCPAPADACLAPACDAGVCAGRPVAGFDRLTCVCRRPGADACVGQKLPRAVGRRRTRACALIHGAATKPKKARRLVDRAGKLLDQAAKAVARAKHVSIGCVEATAALLADDVDRARSVAGELH